MDANTIKQNNIRLIKNTIAMYSRTFIVMLVTLYITRIVLKTLGTENYGIYNVVGTVVVLFTFINSSLSQAIQRFLTIECAKGTSESINKVFNVSIIVQIVISLFLICVCETVGVITISKCLNINEERIWAAQWLFQFSILSTVISILRVPYEAIVIANEKMNFYALASIMDVFLKLLAVLLLSCFTIDSLILYGALTALVSFISLVAYFVYCRIHFNTCQLKRIWDKAIFRDILSFSGWSLSGSVANVATMNGFAILINIYYGVLVNAALGIANQINAAINQFIGNFQTSFRPQIVKAFALGDEQYLMNLISKTSKFSFLLIFIPVMVLEVNMSLVLSLWLGEVPEYAIAFCRLMLICCLFDGLTGSYYCAITATGNIKIYQTAISLSFILDLIISLLLMISQISPTYLLYSRIATRGMLNMFVGLFLMRKQLCFEVGTYLKNVVSPLMAFSAIIIVLCMVLIYYFNSWNLLLISSFTICLMGLIGVRTILTKSERDNLISIIKNIKK